MPLLYSHFGYKMYVSFSAAFKEKMYVQIIKSMADLYNDIIPLTIPAITIDHDFP